MSVRARFAPSPTGFLHVGNIRAALVNWLFVQKEGGEFILRLDDTDPERSQDKYADAIKEDLTWLGLKWDETYKQSDRMAKYEAAAERLIKDGRLYPCYETPDELEVKRKMQLARKLPPVYDRAALKLSEKDMVKLEADGRSPHWRFKIDLPATVEFEDLIRGQAHFNLASVSDPVLVREDGSFLYTLPSVVDDLDMKITHVIRGEDHVTNSAVQTQIYEALGGNTPQFAHFSLLQAADKSALSKREGALSIRHLREDGIEPEAIISLLAKIGTSDPIQPFLDKGPLVEEFDWAKFARATAKFDIEELRGLNAKIVHGLSFDAALARLPDLKFTNAEWQTLHQNLGMLADLPDYLKLVRGPITPVIEDEGFIGEALSLFPEGELSEESWGVWTKAVAEKTGNKGRDLFMPLRKALTGMDHGPEMNRLLPLIGAERAKARLKGEVA